MSARFSQTFKKQAVKKALNRSQGTNLVDLANHLGIGHSTLHRWISQARHHDLELTTPEYLVNRMTKEKRPQDWDLEEKLNMVIACGSLDETGISELCREKGLYPHHIQQWKADFAKGTKDTKPTNKAESKQLKTELKNLKKELRRKDKALAETAALLVLQKKVNAIWGSNEDS